MCQKVTKYLITSLLSSTSLHTAYAQEDNGTFFGLEEIVITASKREQSLQDAGMSVTVLGSQELERMGAKTFTDFAVKIPNLGFGHGSDGRFNANYPTIRGVYGANTTGFYIDDIPVPASMQPRVINLERIETLRGPQGSLYGARSMGGTIRLITISADTDGGSGSVHGSLSTVAEGDTNWSLDASANIPLIADTLAVRVTGYTGHNSGVFDRVYDPDWVNAQTGQTIQNTAPPFDKNHNVDDETYKGAQVSAILRLSENFTFSPKLMYQKIDANGLPFADITADNFIMPRFFDTDEAGKDEWWLAGATANWQTPSGNLVSTLSYFDRAISETEEQTTFIHNLFNHTIGFPVDPLEGPITKTEDFSSVVHETRFTSSLDGAFNYTVGVFFQRNKNLMQYPAESGTVPGLNDAVNQITTNNPNIGVPINLVPGDLIFTTARKFNTREYASFGELTVAINDSLSLTAGGRWYKSETETQAFSDGFANGGTSRTPEDINQEYAKQSESGFNPKFLIQTTLSENINLFVTAAKGYRIGGSNPALPSGLCGEELQAKNISPSEIAAYDSDSLWSYETGIKSKLFNNRLSLNASTYLIKWNGIQQQNRLGCGFSFIDNAGKAESKGFELEVSAAPVAGLYLSFAVGYTDAKITDPEDVANVKKGDVVQGVPNWTVAASGEYIFPLSDDKEAILRADLNHYGRSYSTNNGELRLRPAWTALNLKAGVIVADWEVTLFVDNVTNVHANLADSRNIAVEVPGRPRIVTNRPRTFGIDFRTQF